MSDRIAVISDGRVQQVGAARDIYEEPDNRFVADFIGETNLIDVAVESIVEGQATCTLPGGTRFTCPAASGAHQGRGHLSVRPERVSLIAPDNGLLSGIVSRLIYLGTDMHVDVTLSNGEVMTVRVQNSADTRVPANGEAVGLDFETGAARLLID